MEENKTNNISNENVVQSNADVLKVFAIINLILSVAVAIFVWAKFSTIEVIGEYSYTLQEFRKTTETNGYAIAGGFGIIYGGLVLFFTLMTIVDIFNRVNKEKK